jgi:hypothetical protein
MLLLLPNKILISTYSILNWLVLVIYSDRTTKCRHQLSCLLALVQYSSSSNRVKLGKFQIFWLICINSIFYFLSVMIYVKLNLVAAAIELLKISVQVLAEFLYTTTNSSVAIQLISSSTEILCTVVMNYSCKIDLA